LELDPAKANNEKPQEYFEQLEKKGIVNDYVNNALMLVIALI